MERGRRYASSPHLLFRSLEREIEFFNFLHRFVSSLCAHVQLKITAASPFLPCIVLIVGAAPLIHPFYHPDRLAWREPLLGHLPPHPVFKRGTDKNLQQPYLRVPQNVTGAAAYEDTVLLTCQAAYFMALKGKEHL